MCAQKTERLELSETSGTFEGMDRASNQGTAAATRRALLLALLLLWPRAASARPEYTLKIAMDHSDMVSGRPFLFEVPLDRKKYRDLEFDKRRKIKPYIKKAQMALAKKMGYHEKIYGAKALTYINVTKVIWQVRDEGRRKVVLIGKGK